MEKNKKNSKKEFEEPQFGLRLFAFGTLTMLTSWYLYEWADWLRMERSYNRETWAPEYQLWPSPESAHHSLLKYDYVSHRDLLLILGLGTVNILFYSIFYCDLLTISLPQRLQGLDVFPFVVALIDLVENALYFALLVTFPDITFVTSLVGYVTSLKSALSFLLFFILLVSLLTLPLRWLFSTPSAKKKKEQ